MAARIKSFLTAEKDRERARKWREKNLEQVRAKAREYARLRYKENPELGREQSRQWKKANRDKVRRQRNQPEPTRPEAEFCECCGRWFLSIVPQLDHNHSTGQFRGWLCKQCNLGIGLLGDDVSGLEKALEYLKRNKGQA